MGRRGGRVLWVGASVALLPAAAAAAWWLIGDLTASLPDPDYLFHPPRITARTERWIGVSATACTVGYCAVFLIVMRHHHARWRWLSVVVALLAVGAIVGGGGRIVTAGVGGANIGGGFVVLVAPFLVVFLLGFAIVQATVLNHRARTSAPQQQSPAPNPAESWDGFTVLIVGALLGVTALAGVRLIEPLPVTVEDVAINERQLARDAALRVQKAFRVGYLRGTPNGSISATPRCGRGSEPSVDLNYASAEGVPQLSDALTEQLRAAGWRVEDGAKPYASYFRRINGWTARISVFSVASDGRSLTAHLDVNSDPAAHCPTFHKEIVRALT